MNSVGVAGGKDQLVACLSLVVCRCGYRFVRSSLHFPLAAASYIARAPPGVAGLDTLALCPASAACLPALVGLSATRSCVRASYGSVGGRSRTAAAPGSTSPVAACFSSLPHCFTSSLAAAPWPLATLRAGVPAATSSAPWASFFMAALACSLLIWPISLARSQRVGLSLPALSVCVARPRMPARSCSCKFERSISGGAW